MILVSWPEIYAKCLEGTSNIPAEGCLPKRNTDEQNKGWSQKSCWGTEVKALPNSRESRKNQENVPLTAARIGVERVVGWRKRPGYISPGDQKFLQQVPERENLPLKANSAMQSATFFSCLFSPLRLFIASYNGKEKKRLRTRSKVWGTNSWCLLQQEIKEKEKELQMFTQKQFICFTLQCIAPWLALLEQKGAKVVAEHEKKAQKNVGGNQARSLMVFNTHNTLHRRFWKQAVYSET